MKDLLLLVLQIIAFACVLGFIFSILNMLFGWHVGFKGAEVPADIRATISFAIAAAVCGGIVYFAGRKKA